MNIFKKDKKGISLVGILVSVFILSATFVAILEAQAQAAQLSVSQKYEVTGSFLASEGLEIIRGLRDTNFAIHNATNGDASRPWTQNIMQGRYFVDYTINYANPAASSYSDISSTGCNTLSAICGLTLDTNASTPFYRKTTATETPQFYRYITITDFNPPNSVSIGDGKTVESKVFVIFKGKTLTYSAKMNLYNTDI